MCSNSIDGVGKFTKANGGSYSYKGMVEIIPLAMVDDLLSVTICGMESIKMNITINTLIELKKLKFHTPVPTKKEQMPHDAYRECKCSLPRHEGAWPDCRQGEPSSVPG